MQPNPTLGIRQDEITNAVTRAKQAIRAANKGLPRRVVFSPWRVSPRPYDNTIILQIPYVDGDGRQDYYNIAL